MNLKDWKDTPSRGTRLGLGPNCVTFNSDVPEMCLIALEDTLKST